MMSTAHNRRRRKGRGMMRRVTVAPDTLPTILSYNRRLMVLLLQMLIVLFYLSITSNGHYNDRYEIQPHHLYQAHQQYYHYLNVQHPMFHEFEQAPHFEHHAPPPPSPIERMYRDDDQVPPLGADYASFVQIRHQQRLEEWQRLLQVAKDSHHYHHPHLSSNNASPPVAAAAAGAADEQPPVSLLQEELHQQRATRQHMHADLSQHYDFNMLEEANTLKARVKAKSKTKARVLAKGQGPGNFPEQSWTYKDAKDPPKWLVPDEMKAPGLPLTKPPPVPQMVPPPPPFPPTLDNKGPYSGEGQDYSPPAPTYALPRPPPAALPRWIPWTAYYIPDLAK